MKVRRELGRLAATDFSENGERFTIRSLPFDKLRVGMTSESKKLTRRSFAPLRSAQDDKLQLLWLDGREHFECVLVDRTFSARRTAFAFLFCDEGTGGEA